MSDLTPEDIGELRYHLNGPIGGLMLRADIRGRWALKWAATGHACGNFGSRGEAIALMECYRLMPRLLDEIERRREGDGTTETVTP